MAFDSDRVTTVTFDSYSTFVDVGAVETALADHPDVDDPEPISRLWRSRSMQYTLVGNQTDVYEPFGAEPDLVCEGLAELAERLGC